MVSPYLLHSHTWLPTILPGDPLLALVDALRDGMLNENQRETVQALRDGILALVEQEGAGMD